MKIGPVVSWEHDVLAAWGRSSVDNMVCENSDVWGCLPQNVCWLSARLEECDISSLYVINSGDWYEVFGTFRLVDLALQEFNGNDDAFQHRSRIIEMGAAYATGASFERIILVSHSGNGPFIIIDGNHRAVAMQRGGFLVGQEVFLGLHQTIGSSFCWFHPDVASCSTVSASPAPPSPPVSPPSLDGSPQGANQQDC